MVNVRGTGLRVSSEVCACFEGRWPLTGRHFKDFFMKCSFGKFFVYKANPFVFLSFLTLFLHSGKQKLTNLPGSSKSMLGRLAVSKPNLIFSVLRSQAEITAIAAVEEVVGKHCSLVKTEFSPLP